MCLNVPVLLTIFKTIISIHDEQEFFPYYQRHVKIVRFETRSLYEEHKLKLYTILNKNVGISSSFKQATGCAVRFHAVGILKHFIHICARDTSVGFHMIRFF